MSYLFLILWGGEFYIEPRLNCGVCTLYKLYSNPRPVQLPNDAQTEPDNDNWDLFLKRRHPLP
jgi:hypothetical protein